MKVLLVSQVPHNLERFRKPDQIFPTEQAQASWLKAINQLGHSVEVFLYSEPILIPRNLNIKVHKQLYTHLSHLYAKYRLFKNRYYYLQPENYVKSLKLLSTIKRFKPEIIILSGGVSELVAFPLTKARQLKIKIIMLHGVNPLEGATSFEEHNIKLFDWIVTNDPTHAEEWKKLGATKATCLPYAGIDPDIHKKIKLSAKKYNQLKSDVVFVGTLFPDRQEILKCLIDLPINFKIWGEVLPSVGLDPALKPVYQGTAWGKKVVEIYNATKIAINLIPKHMSIGGNVRTFEIPGCSALAVSNKPNLWFTNNKEILTFRNSAELKDNIIPIMKNHRTTIYKKNSYIKCQKNHTYKKRFQIILK